MAEVSRRVSFSENLPSVPKFVYANENQWMHFFQNLPAVPKLAIYCNNPWMPNSFKKASVPNEVSFI